MKYKMFVSDLDRTLLDDNDEISKENLLAIQGLRSKGVKFVIATGRTHNMVKNYLAILDYDMPLIWCNGAGVSDLGGKILHHYH